MDVASAGIGGGLVVLIGAMVTAYVTVMKSRHDLTKDEDEANHVRRTKDGATIYDQQNALIARQSAEITQNRLDVHALRNEVQAVANHNAICQAQRARDSERIGYLEAALDAAKIPYYKRPDGGSGVHPVAPPPEAPK